MVTIPKTIRARSAQKHARATPERSRRVAYPAAPKPAMKSAVAPPACQPDWDAEAEEQANRELLGAPGGEVEADQEPEARDERREAPPVGQVPTKVGTECEQPRGDRHEAHRLAEERARLVARDRRLKSCVDGAHLTLPCCSGLSATAAI